MDYFEFERKARANAVLMRDYRNGSKNGFWVTVQDVDPKCKDVQNNNSTTADKLQFVANLYGYFQLCANGYVSDILNKVIVSEKDYFLSGVNVPSNEVIEVPLYSEVSREMEKGVLHEKIVDIEYLAEMHKHRHDYKGIDKHLETERYLVKAAIVDMTKDAASNLYDACQHPACNAAKVLPVNNENGHTKYRCTKCGFTNPSFERRVMPKLELVDPENVHNESAERITVAIFKGNAEALFEVEEKEMVTIFEEQDSQHIADVFSQIYGVTAVFRLKANVFQDRISYSVYEIFME